jgi:N6-adenosine-specific RNA methylase IME4
MTATHSLPNKRYGVIIADPPWSFKVRSDKGLGRSAQQHYDCMSLNDIKKLSVANIALPDCVLLLWVTDPMLPRGLEVMEAWGFEFKTVGFYWTKTNADGTPFCGMGYWSRANPEQCLLGVRGHPKRQSARVRRLITAPRREHSRKPDEVYQSARRLLAGPYIELFAREKRLWFDGWGLEYPDAF